MTKSQYIEVKKYIRDLEDRAIKEGIRLSSPDYNKILSLKIKELGYSLKEYEDFYNKENKGDKGDTGPPGPAGKDGKDGLPGKDGKPGKPGKSGSPGKDGKNGKDGKAGKDGKDGIAGEPGEPCEPGKPGKDGKSIDSKKLKKELKAYIDKVLTPGMGRGGSSGKGSRFYNWGMPDKGSYGTAIPDSRYYKKEEVDTLISAIDLSAYVPYTGATTEVDLGSEDLTTLGNITGGTLVVTDMATLADGSKLATSAAPTADAEIANKKYVDDNGGGSPGGNDTEIQYNDGGSFAGDANFTFNKTTKGVTIGNPESGAPLILGRITGQASVKAKSDAEFGWLIFDGYSDGDVMGLNYYVDGDVYLAQGGGNVYMASRLGAFGDPAVVITNRARIYANEGANDTLIIQGKGNDGVYMNYDQGSGGVEFYNGSTVKVASVDSSGNASFIGTLTSGDGGTTNYAQFSATGTLTLAGTARIIKDLWIDSSGIKAPGDKPATEVSHGNLDIAAWQFADQAVEANQESVSWRTASPYDMDRTEDLTIRIGWSSASTGNVKWQLEYRWLAEDEDTTLGAEETLTVVDAASTTANGLIITDITGIDAPDSTDASIFFKLTRLSADEQDTITDTVELHGICFNYISDKLGESL